MASVGAKIGMQLYKLIYINSVILKSVRLWSLFYQMVLISKLLLGWFICAQNLLTKDEFFMIKKKQLWVCISLETSFWFNTVRIHTYLLLTLGVRLRIVLFSMLLWAMSDL